MWGGIFKLDDGNPNRYQLNAATTCSSHHLKGAGYLGFPSTLVEPCVHHLPTMCHRHLGVANRMRMPVELQLPFAQAGASYAVVLP
jgi:hypothetical protein